jgi:uncharacterized metal-binding protein YceD (DUF177 family)
MSQKPNAVPEFSRPISRERLGSQILIEEVSATPEERAALARRFNLLGFDLLRATAKIEPADGLDSKGGAGLLRLSGHLSAEVSQACVVTLEPVASRIETEYTVLYSLEPGPTPASVDEERTGVAEVVVDPVADDPPEPLGPDGLDLGEAVAQQLALALDPYPRAPGAALGAPSAAEASPQRGFAVLEALKRRE